MNAAPDSLTDLPPLLSDRAPAGMLHKTGAAMLLAAISLSIAGPVRLFMFPSAAATAHSSRSGPARHHVIVIDAVSEPDQD